MDFFFNDHNEKYTLQYKNRSMSKDQRNITNKIFYVTVFTFEEDGCRIPLLCIYYHKHFQ